jgi:predicted nucleotidyltransferase
MRRGFILTRHISSAKKIKDRGTGHVVSGSAIVDIPFTKSRNVRHSGMFLAGIHFLCWMPAKNMLA